MDNQYILLQNNKQVGPFNQQELAQITLSPTDFVWIQGKSSSWQPAQTFNELRPYLKPAETESYQDKKDTTSTIASSATTVAKTEKTNLKISEDPDSLSHIYVRFPVTIQESVFEEVETDTPEGQPKSVKEENFATLVPMKAADEKVIAPEHYRSLEEIRNEYASWVKQHERQPGKGVSKQVVVILFAVTITVIAWSKIKPTSKVEGASISYDVKGVHEKVKQSSITSADDDAGVADTPLSGSATTAKETSTVGPKANSNSNAVVPLDQSKTESTEAELARIEVSTVPATREETNVGSDSRSVVLSPGTQNKSIQTSFPEPAPVVEKQVEPAVPLTSLVDVKSNYVSNKKSGITSMNVTVNNRSNKLLTLVAVDVFYYKANKDLVSKKTLYFSNVKPGSEVKLDAAASDVAVSAECKLGLISNGEAITYNKQ